MKANNAHNTARIMARQSPAVPIKAPSPTGVGHACWATGGLTNCNLMAKYASDIDAIGARKNGIAVNGLYTIGIPNRIGSLMLKIAGTKDA